jgi:hypothetical protein
VEQELRYRRWRWLGYTLRRPLESIVPPGTLKVNGRKADPEIPGESKIKRTRKT